MIEFLNINSGSILALATLILVIATIYYAIITHNILKSNKKANQELFRPVIIVSINSVDSCLQLRIRNIGNRDARNVSIEFTPSLDELDTLLKNIKGDIKPHRKFLEQKYIPPGFDESTTLMFTPDFVTDDVLNKKFETIISYEDENGKNYTGEFNFDIEQYLYQDKTIEYTNNHHLKNISKHLKELKEHLINRN